MAAKPATHAAAEPIWVLLGSKQGDNSQMLALAESLGLPFRRIQLRFNLLHWLLPAMLGATLLSIRNRRELAGGSWPRLVISSGLRSVPAARWLKKQSSGQAKLVHIGRPWGPFHWFDLIVTTPQYALPLMPNVHHNLLPLMAERSEAQASDGAQAHWSALPRPWTMAVLGGHSRPLRFTPDAARALAEQLNDLDGSVFVLGSPRTPSVCIDALRTALGAAHHVFPFGEGSNPYHGLREQADHFWVTGDSVQMAAELLVCGKPLTIFPLPEKPDLLVRLSRLWRLAAARWWVFRPAFEWARNRGLLSSLRDIGLFHQQLHAAGVYRDPDLARQLRSAERNVTVDRINRLLREPGAAITALKHPAPAASAPHGALRQP